MQLCISNIAWEPSENDMVLPILAELGIRALEVAPTKLFRHPDQVTSDALAMCRSQWEERGFSLVAMQSLLFGRPDLMLFETPDRQTACLEYLFRIMALAHGLGVRVLVFGSPKNRTIPGTPAPEHWEQARHIFARLGQEAHRLGLKFCIEPSTPAHGCNFLTSTRDVVSFVQSIGSPGLGVHLDVGMMIMNAELIEATIDLAFDYLEHVHISEPNLQPVYEGSAPHARVARHLQRVQYNKYVSVEMLPVASSNTATHIRAALEFAQSHYVSMNTR